MTQLTITSPQDLTDQGFEVVEPKTLLDDPLLDDLTTSIERLIARYPVIVENPYVLQKLKMLRRDPWPYQVRYAALSSLRRRNLLAYEQGLGKTFIACLKIWLRYGERLMHGLKLRPGVVQILAPRYALGDLTWMKELRLVGLADHAEIIRSEKDLAKATKPIWLMTYDFLKAETSKGQMMRRFRQGRETSTGQFYGEPMWKLIRQKSVPSYAIIDEVHMLRAGSARTKAIRHWIRGVKHRDGMTGTPMDGWVHHLSAIMAVIYGEGSVAFPWTMKDFNALFVREQTVAMDLVTGEESAALARRRIMPGVEADRIPAFHANTRHLMHRLLARDPEAAAHIKFPPVFYHKRLCTMTPNHARFYLDVNTKMVEQMRNLLATAEREQEETGTILNRNALRNNVLGRMQTLRFAAAAPWALKDYAWAHGPDEVAKLQTLLELCFEYACEGRKIIVFTNQIAVGGVVTRFLQEAGLGVTRVYASDPKATPKTLSQEERESRIEDFLESPLIQVLVGNLGLMSTALTLTAASVIIHYDHEWKANPRVQGDSRIIRHGQVWDHVDIVDLVMNRTCEVYVYKFQRTKMRANAQAIDRDFESHTQDFDSGPIDEMQAVAELLNDDHPDDSAEEAT